MSSCIVSHKSSARKQSYPTGMTLEFPKPKCNCLNFSTPQIPYLPYHGFSHLSIRFPLLSCFYAAFYIPILSAFCSFRTDVFYVLFYVGIYQNSHAFSSSFRNSLTIATTSSSEVRAVCSASPVISCCSICIAYTAELTIRTAFPFTTKVTQSPLATPRTSRTSFGIVTCPFDMTFALSINAFASVVLHHLSDNTESRDSSASIMRRKTEKSNGSGWIIFQD